MDDILTLFKLAIFTFSFSYVAVWCAEFQRYGTAKPLSLQSRDSLTTRVFSEKELDNYKYHFIISEETSHPAN
jgi:hypothetical protein